MKLQSLVQLTGVFLLAGSSTCFAQCETKEMSENFAYVAKGGVGTICTTDYEQSKKFGTTEIKQLDDQCVEARTTGHAKEASRTPNGWLCTPAERTILVHISYCR